MMINHNINLANPSPRLLPFSKFFLNFNIPTNHASLVFPAVVDGETTIYNAILQRVKKILTEPSLNRRSYSKTPFQILEISSKIDGNNFQVCCRVDRRIWSRKKHPFVFEYQFNTASKGEVPQILKFCIQLDLIPLSLRSGKPKK